MLHTRETTLACKPVRDLQGGIQCLCLPDGQELKCFLARYPIKFGAAICAIDCMAPNP